MWNGRTFQCVQKYMSSENIDYSVVLADLVAKRDDLNAAIKAVERIAYKLRRPGERGNQARYSLPEEHSRCGK